MCIEYYDGKFLSREITCSINQYWHYLKAIHGPLQERGIILHLDYNRANTFPTDYDTDLESDWTNESENHPFGE